MGSKGFSELGEEMELSNAQSKGEKASPSVLLGRRIDLALTLIIMVIAIVFIYLLQSLPIRATFFPWFITISIMCVGTFYLIGKYKAPAKWDDQYVAKQDNPKDQDLGPAYFLAYRDGILRTIFVFFCLVIATFAFGQKFAVPLFLTIMLWTAKENKIVAILSGLFFFVIIEFVFGGLMSINLPVGYVIEWLGLDL